MKNNHPSSDRITVKRISDRGVYDKESIYRIIDEALICHVAFVDHDHPYGIPTIHTRIDDHLYLHGSRASRMLDCICHGARACVTVTLLDGLVLARSAFHHSMNYRSVVILGEGKEVADRVEKLKVLDALVEHVIPGRLHDARGPNENELNATRVVSIPIHEASAKVRTGPPSDDEKDYEMSIWAGVIPLSLQVGAPQSDPRLREGIEVPDYVSSYRR